MKYVDDELETMLRESNAIEDEFDDDSYEQAVKAFKFIIKHDKLSSKIIKETHAILMKNMWLRPEYIGDYRDIPVTIGGKYKFQPKIVIESLVEDFCDDINELPDTVIPMHVRFERIHPFLDGNGRMGRLIMNWHSIQRKEGLVIFTRDKRDDYYKLFK